MTTEDRRDYFRNAAPFLLHDAAMIEAPVPACVSRVTIAQWCPNYHSDTPEEYQTNALAGSMRDTITRIRAETADDSDFYHGLLIHGVQERPQGEVYPVSISTARQYISRYTDMSSMVLAGGRAYGAFDHLLVLEDAPRHAVPKWVWHHLAGALLCKTEKVVQSPLPQLS